MNILFLSAGRRVELLKDFRQSLSVGSRIIATDNSKYAPAIYFADRAYLVPKICAKDYIDKIVEICKKEQIDAITTLIDPEILILAEKRDIFENMGITVLVPFKETASLAFDKFEMYKYLVKNKISTPRTCGSLVETLDNIGNGSLKYPLFVKPRRGSGSVGAKQIGNREELVEAFTKDNTLIVQENMTTEGGIDLDADIYVDTISHEPVSIFCKKKISTTLGGANKTISFKDERLFSFIKSFVKKFRFNGPLDADFFYKNGQYYLSEINPRFGGAYLHAYGAGVDFVKLIEKNVNGEANEQRIGDYEENIVMMMYDSVIIKKIDNEHIVFDNL